MKIIVQKAEKCKKQKVLGDNQTVLLSGRDTNNQILIIEQHDNPGVGIPLHVHKNEDEIFNVLEGQLEITNASETYILNPGDTAFCPRGVPHSWRVIGNEKTKTILTIYPATIETMFEELANLHDFDFDKVVEIANRYDINFL